MTPERWQKIRKLFHAAVELDSPQRARYLDQACADDASLRKEVEALFSRHGRAESFLESPALAPDDQWLSEARAASTGQQAPVNGGLAGQRLGRYHVVEEIGSGGMGVVYRARDERLDRDVALKVLPAAALADEAARKRFRNEALALSRLNHAHIAAVYDFDSQEGTDFLVIECVPGTTLAEKLAAGSLAEKEAARLGLHVASALEEAHEHGVVHCDLKPGNIMVTPKGQAKVLDFGLAKLLRAPGEAVKTDTLSLTQTFAGTLPYMAPEQLRGERSDPRTDIWALGAILYEMTTGQLPFPQGHGPALIAAILNEQLVPPTSLNRRISPALENVILKALDKDPENRYQSAKELGVDLRRLVLPSSATTVRAAARKHRFRWAALGVGLAALLLLAIVVGWDVGGWRQRLLARARPIHIRSIAVLPLENLSGDPAQEYFSEGMTDALITDLAQISSLKVISRTSVMRYKSTRKPLPEIAKELNVEGIVEGVVVRSGERVRVDAQLIEASTDRHLWARTYERSLGDVIALQSEVARAVSHEIHVQLTPQEQARLARTGPVDPQAYEFYLKGRYFWNKYTEASVQKSMDYFQQAIQRDANYALAYAGMADAYIARRDLSPAEAFPKSKAMARIALQMDEGLAEAHNALAQSLFHYDWDWAGAEKEFQRAIALNPNYGMAHQWYGLFLRALGRQNWAAEIKRAHEVDPLLTFPGISPYIESGQYDLAMESLRKRLELDPNFAFAYLQLGGLYRRKGMYQDAITQIQKGLSLSGGEPEYLSALGYTYGVWGKRDEARKTMKQLMLLSTRRYVSPYDIAMVYIGLGEKDLAFDWLQKAVADRSRPIVNLKLDDKMAGMRSDPRYSELLRRIGLPQ